jgi:hypothetical protein
MGSFDDDDRGRRHRLAPRFASMVDEGIDRRDDIPPGLQV